MASSKGQSQSEDILIRPKAHDRWPRGIACDGGFRILGTPIGFGRARGADLQFLSHVDDPAPSRGTRVLITPFLSQAMDAEKKGFDALTLGYGRRIRLGRMDIRLFPAGLGLGSSQFEVSFKDRKIVYVGGVRLARPLAAPPAAIPSCDMLLIDAAPAEPRPPSPKRVSAQLKAWVEETLSSGLVPVLSAGSVASALDAAWTLRQLDIPIRACRPIFEMLKRTENVGFSIPGLKRLEQICPTTGAVLHFARLWPNSKFIATKSTLAAYVGPGRNKPKWAKIAFRLGEGEDRPGIVSYVKKTNATQVALGPLCDEATSLLLRNAGFNVYQVQHPEQIPLPF